jgi:hypothetical protein
MRRTLVLVVLAAMLAAVPFASATPTVSQGALNINGTATDCLVVVTPIALFGPTPVLVLLNFAGSPQAAEWFAIGLTSGSVNYAWNGTLYVVSSNAAQGTAVAGP